MKVRYDENKSSKYRPFKTGIAVRNETIVFALFVCFTCNTQATLQGHEKLSQA